LSSLSPFSDSYHRLKRDRSRRDTAESLWIRNKQTNFPNLVELASGFLKDLSNNKVAEDRMSKIAIVGNEPDLTAALSAWLE